MVPAVLDEKYVIRYCVNAQNLNDDDILTGWEFIKSYADNTIKQYEFENPTHIASNCSNGIGSTRRLQASMSIDEEDQSTQLTSKLRRLRFGVSKMVSEPRISLNQKKYKRTSTTYRFGSSSDSTGKYLARRCSFVEKLEDEVDLIL